MEKAGFNKLAFLFDIYNRSYIEGIILVALEESIYSWSTY